MLFVFAALLEYAVVQFLSRQTDGKLYQQKCEEMRLLKLPGGAQQMDNEGRFHHFRICSGKSLALKTIKSFEE